MLGAIYGDKAGSIYEFEQLKGATTGLPKEYIKILKKAYESIN